MLAGFDRADWIVQGFNTECTLWGRSDQGAAAVYCQDLACYEVGGG